MARGHKQGDIYYATLASDHKHIQTGTRPVIIIQNNVGNRYSPTVTVVPLTSKKKSISQPTHAVIQANEDNGLKCSSIVLGEQITTIPVDQIGKRVGKLNNEDLKVVWQAVLNQISITPSKSMECQ